MSKKLFLPLSALCLGAVGAVLKYVQEATSYDEKGLIPSGDPVTMALAVLSVLFCVYALIVGLRFRSESLGKLAYSDALSPGKAGMAANIIASLVIIAASALYYIGSDGLTGRLIAVLGFLTGVSFALSAVLARLKREGGWLRAFTAVPPLFFCLMMAATYKEYAARPVLAMYCYNCLAYGCSALTLCGFAGHAFSGSNGFVNVTTGLAAIYFLITSLPGCDDVCTMAISGAAAVVIAVNLSQYIGVGLNAPAPQASETDEE